MYTLYHHPFCPHSRFIRLVLGEHGLDLRLVEERGFFSPIRPHAAIAKKAKLRLPPVHSPL